MTLYLLIILLVLIAAFIGVRFWYKALLKKKHIEWLAIRQYITLQILVPRDNEKSPVSAEQMFASLHGIFKPEEKWQEQISLEIVSKDKYIYFYAHVPVEYKDFLEGQIYAQYPTVEISKIDDYSNIGTDSLKSVGCEMMLSKNEVYPIKTFVSFEVDPLSAITSVLAKVDNDEQIWIQVIIKPVSDDWQESGVKYIDAIKAGKTPEKNNNYNSLIRWFLNLISMMIRSLSNTAATVAEGESKPASPEVKLSGPVEAALKGIETKIVKLGFKTKIRFMVLSKDEHTARAKCSIIAGTFKQFSTTNLNSFLPSKIISGQDILKSYQNREFFDDGYILNIEELASLYHLPTKAVETPSIVWAGSKKGEPPADLPIESSANIDDLTVFAKSNFRHLTHRFGIKKKDRRLHMYAIGKTGTGKSTMLENMIIDDIKKGRGVAVVDPHGELINHIINYIPSERINDVIYFNPADREWPIGFNVLESVDPDLKNIVASGVVGIFKKIFGESWGPRLEYILRNAILALLDYPDSSLLGVMKILVDKEFRKKVLEKVKDPIVKDFFVSEYNLWDQKFRLEAIQSIQNKVGQFLSSSTIRNIVGQPKSTFDIEEVMDNEKILLLNLSIGQIGEDNAALLGAMMITKIQLSAMGRARIKEEDRKDFYLYVDEFQNFATESFAVILSEARKYKLNLIMTNQFIAQMNEAVAKAVFGNVGSIVAFRVGSTDAGFLVKEFAPVFEDNDLVNLGNYHIYIKMAIDGVTRPAFSAVTLPPYSEKTDNVEKIIRSSRERYAKPKSFVEEKIQQWSSDLQKPSENPAQIKADNVKKIIEAHSKPMPKHPGVNEITDTKGNKWYQVESYEKKDNKEVKLDTKEVKAEIKEIKEDIKEEKLEKKEVKPEIIINKEIKKIQPQNNQTNQSQSSKQVGDVREKKKPDHAELKSILAPILAKKFQKRAEVNNKTTSDNYNNTNQNNLEIPKAQAKDDNSDIHLLNAEEIVKFDK